MPALPHELWVTVGANAISGIIMLGGGLFVIIQNWRKDLNRLFFFLTVSTLLYTTFFIVASLQTNYDAAYFWWFLNIFDVFITMAIVHFVLRVANRHESWRWFIILTYIVGAVIFIVAWLYPTWFLPTVLPKLYFPYYLEAGWWYSVMLGYFLLFPCVAAVNLLIAYSESSGIERQRLEYIVLMLIVGYSIGCTNFLLVYNILFDPLFGSLVGFYLIPIAYGIFSTDLLDIRLVLRRAFYYALSIACITAFLTLLILLNEFLTTTLPWLSFWTVPIGVAVTAFVIGTLVLRQSRETERLKYEFITVAAHKLRTPLTHIHWIIPELLKNVGTNKELREGIQGVDDANNRLIELTNILLEAAQSGNVYSYKEEAVDLVALAESALAHFNPQIVEKKLVVTRNCANAPLARGDRERTASVVYVFIENAVVYTPAGGSLTVTIELHQGVMRLSVTDSGIGISPDDKSRIFSAFFRTTVAKTADTEGVGIGLSLAKGVIEKQGGRIGVESEGEGKGSTFWFTLPLFGK